MLLHADLDAFFASVEQRDDPALRGRPVLVGGGVVLACSYEAKAAGVRSAMGLAEARRRCPDAVVVPPRMAAYAEASRRVFEVFDRTTPRVEPLSIDEAFLDVGGLRRLAGEPATIAEQLRAAVRAEVGLPITVGVASTKFLAKVASAVGKPDGLLVVPPGGELAFLHPLPVERLWGVGPVTGARLRARELRTVADLAALPEAALVAIVGGAAGRHLHALAHNRDPRRVQAGRRRRSIGAQRALGVRSRPDPDALAGYLAGLVDRVTRRLRGAERTCRTVVVRFRLADFSRVSRSVSLAVPTSDTATILAAALELLAGARPTLEAEGCTLVGVALTNLGDAGALQLALPFTPGGPDLDGALDRVRERFGSTAVVRARLTGRPGVEMPVLPD